ncbi:hypothetical protein J3R82DRAFT_1388 [Butyriboletus roseoflavus]|nr:hypothetical protein J3R82DRAFT_1388 [Butyriboletus roseoflavus]
MLNVAVVVSRRVTLRLPRPAHFHSPRPVVLSHAFARPFASSVTHRSLLSPLLPKSLRPSPNSSSSLRKVIALAKPEKKPLLIAICLLLVSSSVAMTIPLTVGKLIDFFSASNPVSGHCLLSFASSSRPDSAPRRGRGNGYALGACSIYRTDSQSIRHLAYSS